MICSNCATELPAGALFCGECGRPVSARPAPPVSTSAPPEPRGAEQTGREAASETAAEELVAPIPTAREPLTVTAEWDDLGADSDSSLPAVVAAPAARLDDPADAPAPLEPSTPPPTAAPAPPPAPAEPDPYADAAEAQGRGAGWCAQCGALLSASDIFCGECGFVRSPASRPRDTAVLDPFPWGSAPAVAPRPVAPEPVAPSAPRVEQVPSPEPAPAAEHPDLDDDTRLVAPGARADRFVLQFSTGESVTVTGAGLLGRNPMPEPGEYFDALVTISDPGKSVSKTHLEFGQDGGSFWVSDRYSGNGTIVREPDRPSRRCEPGKRYRIARGTRVDIGEQFFVVS
ncbi:zinc-ribbon domain-containing protein [Salinibacterium soli]|uniref:FHA domain-containing protein n=1 Tax=Antiquaquibacter soli TaxID=3064523 RepID=A0ABT9BM55_9MICO|nr:zinc-ribbon domain-containing protein [Protaetiibacter sp. WY-16]MDO7881543.1 FHA domain-containing protein [Protaetiibacter sp. WY-16]